jgi:hypothetical protein
MMKENAFDLQDRSDSGEPSRQIYLFTISEQT